MKGKRDKSPAYKIIRRKLGRERAHGQADEYVEIDPRLKGAKELEIIIHECAHIEFPDQDEDKIERLGIRLAKTLWREGYRKVDNDTSQPLQDKSKVV
jgi:hypothetical protein